MTILYVETQVTIKESNASDGRLCTDEEDIVDATMPCEEDSGTKFSAQSSHDVISENFNEQADSKQNELAEEVNYLKSGLQLVRQDRDYQLAQVQSLMADIEKQKEIARRCAVEVDNAMKKVSALEEGCLSQRETIRTLQIQLASANEKLTPYTSSSAVRVENPNDTLNRISRGMFGDYVNAFVSADGNYSSPLDDDLALF